MLSSGYRARVRFDDFAEQVLDLVERIPAGRVLAYGDVARLLGAGGPRQVGRVMSRWGAAGPWHRVVRADGSPARGHEAQALALLRADGTPLAADGRRVDMGAAAWDGPER
jgi:alkylated DNA nucleotide flippase Atl1